MVYKNVLRKHLSNLNLNRTLKNSDVFGDKARTTDPTLWDFYSWTTSRGCKLGPGIALVFSDQEHLQLAAEFNEEFKNLGLEVRKTPLKVQDAAEHLENGIEVRY
jgi:hypothetical protein